MSVRLDGTDARAAQGQQSQYLLDQINSVGQKLSINKEFGFIYGGLFVEKPEAGPTHRLIPDENLQAFNAQFSPDGQQVVFHGKKRQSANKVTTEFEGIWLVNTDGSGLRRLLGIAKGRIFYIGWIK